MILHYDISLLKFNYYLIIFYYYTQLWLTLCTDIDEWIKCWQWQKFNVRNYDHVNNWHLKNPRMIAASTVAQHPLQAHLPLRSERINDPVYCCQQYPSRTIVYHKRRQQQWNCFLIGKIIIGGWPLPFIAPNSITNWSSNRRREDRYCKRSFKYTEVHSAIECYNFRLKRIFEWEIFQQTKNPFVKINK